MNYLNSKHFSRTVEQESFLEYLKTLDHIVPIYVSRRDYNRFHGDILSENGNSDDYGDFYNLYLPTDLKRGELIQIIYYLRGKLNLGGCIAFDEIINNVKVSLIAILRLKKGKQIINEAINELNIGPELIEEIQNHGISFSQTKKFLRKIKSKRQLNTKERLVQDRKNKLKGEISESYEDKENIFHELSEIFSEEFFLTFFDRGGNLLQNCMKTFTKIHLESLLKYYEENGYAIQIKLDSIIFRKGNEKIIIRSTELGDEEILLRQAIGIEELKELLDFARASNNFIEIERLEIEACNRILKFLYDYPYIFSNSDGGYKVVDILRKKEIYCVGFSLLGHSLLSELGINHNALSSNNHSALEVFIGDSSYFFDASSFSSLKEIRPFNKSKGIYKEYFLYDDLTFVGSYISGDPRRILTSQIMNNLSTNVSLTSEQSLFLKIKSNDFINKK